MSIQSVNAFSPSPNLQHSTSTEAASNAKARVTTTDAKEASSLQPASGVKPSHEQLRDVVNTANDLVKPFNDSLLFSLDEDTGTTVVKVVDTETKEVIKQIPSEEMLALAKALDQLRGLLVKQKA